MLAHGLGFRGSCAAVGGLGFLRSGSGGQADQVAAGWQRLGQLEFERTGQAESRLHHQSEEEEASGLACYCPSPVPSANRIARPKSRPIMSTTNLDLACFRILY